MLETDKITDEFENAITKEKVKAELDLLGVQYHHALGLDKLVSLLESTKEKINTAKSIEKTNKELKQEIRKKILTPVLAKISCVNPNKKSHRGEHIYYGNSVTGRCVDFIPFNSEGEETAIYVSPMVIDILKSRRFASISKIAKHENRTNGNRNLHKTVWKPEFVIEIIS